MTYVTNEARQLAKKLWVYQRLNEKVFPVEVVIAMGCEDSRVAERAAELYANGYCKWIICTGRSGMRTKAMLESRRFESEAAYFSKIALDAGVPRNHILIEDQATNSGENIAYTKELFATNNINHKNIIVVVPPYSERRQQATYAKQWPEQKIIVTSPQLTYETYSTEDLNEQYLINSLVGRVQRMKIYAEQGFQITVEIPSNIWRAYERLVKLGYSDQLM